MIPQLLTAVLAGFAGAGEPSNPQDWPGWLGANRDGVWREAGTLTKFPAGGPKVLWRAPISGGNSGPAVAGGKVYVMDRRTPPKKEGEAPPKGTLPGSERVVCLDAATGKPVWEHEYDCPYEKVAYTYGPRVTPMVHQGRVYTLGTMGHLKCLDAATGKPVWEKNLPKEYATKPPLWGYSATPLIDGDQLITLVGGKGSAVVSFDLATGKEKWKALTAEDVCYVPPVVVSVGKARQLIVFLDNAVHSLDPATGRPYWNVPYPEDGNPQRPAVNIAMPVLFDGDKLLVSSGYHGSVVLQLDQEKPAAKVRWRDKGNLERPQGLHALMTTPVVRDGCIYGIGGFGELRCQRAADNATAWETTKVFGKKAFCGTAFLVPNGDHWYLFTDQGELIIAKLTPEGYQEIDRAKVIERTQVSKGRDVVYSHPAFARGCAFIRNDKELVCVDLKEKQ